MRKKVEERERRRKRGNANWNPKLGDKVLVKGQNQSDATKGLIDKLMPVYQGPYIIGRVLPHSSYELVDSKGKSRGEFNKRQLKPYRTDVASKLEVTYRMQWKRRGLNYHEEWTDESKEFGTF